jgi:hypothetical protein
MKGKIRISVVATGIDVDAPIKVPEVPSSPKTFAASDIRNEYRPVEKQVIEAVSGQGQRVFFDPGVSVDPELGVSEIRTADFGSRKVLDDIEAVTMVEEKITITTQDPKKETKRKPKELDPEEHEEILFEEDNETYQVSFASGLFEEEEDKFKKAAHKISKSEEKKYVEPAKSKKEGGFGLFGFMNRGNKAEAEKPKPTKAKKSEKESGFRMVEDDAEEVRVISDKKSHHNKGAKISKTPHPDDFSVEDDILNVPAFFRRKK